MAGITHAQVATAVGCSGVLVSRVLTGKTAERRGWSAMVVQVAERLLAEATGQAIPVRATSPPLRTVPAIREALLRERAELDELRLAMLAERDQTRVGKRELAEQQRRVDAERRKLELGRIAAGLPRRLEIVGISRTQLAKAARRNISQVSRVLAGHGTSPHIVQVAERLLARVASRRRQGKREHNK